MLEEITGHRPEDLGPGGLSPLDDVVHPDDRARLLASARGAVDRDAPIDAVVRLRAKDGTLRHVVCRGRPALGPDGGSRHVEGLILDITSRLRAEEHLRKVNEALIALGPDFDANVSRLTALAGEMMDATCALYNRLDRGRLCTWGRWQAPPDLPAEDAPSGHICYDVIRRAENDVLLIPDLPSTRYAETDPNVRAYGLQTYVGHVVRCGGAPVGSLCVVYQRTFIPTEEDRRLLGILAAAIGREELRRRGEEAVRQSETRLATIIASARDSIFLKDPGLRYTLANPAMEALFGKPAPELLGKTDADLFGAETAAHSAEVDRRVLAGEVVEEEVEKPVNGVPRVFHTVKVPLRGAGGTVTGLCGVAREITERRQADAALRASEEKFRALVENAPDVIMRFDREGRHLYVNPAVTRIVPIRPSDFVGKTHRELGFPPELCRQWEEALRSVVETRQTHESEFTFEEAGRRFVFHWRLVPEFGPRGVVASVLSIARDITDRRETEEALRESEARYRAVFENILDVYYEVELDGTILEVSPSVEMVSRYRRDELIGTSMYRLYEDAAVRDRLVAALREQGRVRDYEVVLLEKNGNRIPCAITARLRPGEGSRPPKICGVMRPIAERKMAEEALLRSQDRLRALLDASPVPIIALAADGTVENWNQAAERMFGYTRKEALGRRNPIVPESHQAVFDAVVARVLAGEELGGAIRPALCKDGTVIEVVASTARYCDASGKPIGLMTLFMKAPAPDADKAPPPPEPSTHPA
jgi:PAS domain S-box-containing protein